MPTKRKSRYLLILILLLTFALRIYQIGYPKGYVFDEVYHAFTAKEYLKGSKEAWEWWTTPPPGVAYEWTHPPIAKEVMAASMYTLKTTDSWAWRIPGILLGTLSVLFIYLIGKTLFRNESVGLISAFIFSIDGLNFVQSRTGMNDIYFVTFMLACTYFLLSKKHFLSSLCLGLALASKWTGIYLFGLVFFLLLINRQLKNITYYILIPPIVYLTSYIPFFYLGHTKDQFIELQKQMWWYHANLKATHDYASPWWSWPLNLFPVWYFVDYQNNTLANIFASGNPAVFWGGIIALFFTIRDLVIKRSKVFLVILAGYFVFWLPWVVSPRIMFLYHYSPSVPFLSLALGYQLTKLSYKKEDRFLLFLILAILVISFISIYPILVGIPLPKNILQLFFSINLTKNPFGGS